MFTTSSVLFLSAVTLLAAAAADTGDEPANLSPVPFTAVKVQDHFWSPRIKLNLEKVLPHNFQFCESTGRIGNFAKAAGLEEGPFKGIFYDDSDVYKVIEGAAYSLAHVRDPGLEKTTDAVIDKIAAAQQSDGYLYTFYTVNKQLDRRYSEMYKMHELYCAGHLIEAAVAYHQSTGKRKLLDVAIKLADHIESVFGPDKRRDIDGHQEIELALYKLARHAGDEKYAKLAEFFINERGNNADKHRRPHADYAQDEKPIRAFEEITGHAVRAMYYFSGATDLAARTNDRALIAALDKLWHDVVHRKMYITGGIGPSAHNEGFTVPYDLPNDSAYAETCAAVGMAFWNHRLALLHGDAKYADVMERSIYNGLISGVSLTGDKFFYVNPLGSRGRHHRKEWYSTSCCPTNVVRFLPTVGGYAYATSTNAIYVNLFVTGAAEATVNGTKVTIAQHTHYPWDGNVKFTLNPEKGAEFALNLRIPSWSRNATIKINGESLKLEMSKGYARLHRAWKANDTVELVLPMPVERVKAHPNVKANVGRVALQRGPIVYCLEGADNTGAVRNLILPRDAQLTPEFRPDLLGGVAVVKGKGLARVSKDETKPVDFTAIPYYAWDNREAGQMVVWLPEEPALAELPIQKTIASQSTPTASHTWHLDTREALNDQLEPADSNDHAIPRFTWWDKHGTTEWVQYTFASPTKVSSVEVYWFDDAESNGGCRRPRSWRLLYKDGDTWKPVAAKSDYTTHLDEYNKVEFDPIETDAIRLEATLQPSFSSGILEWRVN